MLTLYNAALTIQSESICGHSTGGVACQPV